jgi:hypothetical protein
MLTRISWFNSYIELPMVKSNEWVLLPMRRVAADAKLQAMTAHSGPTKLEVKDG